jgi:hypothetical protein
MKKSHIPNKACLLAIAPAALCMSAPGAPVVHKDVYDPATVVLEDFSGGSDPSTGLYQTTFSTITGGAATYNYAAAASPEGYINYGTLATPFDPTIYKSMRLRMAINRDSAASTSIDVFPTPVPGAGSVTQTGFLTGTTLRETSFDLSTKSPNGLGVRIDPFNYVNDATDDQCQIDYIMADRGATIGFEFNHDADFNQATLINISPGSVAGGVLSGTASTVDSQISLVGGGAPTIDAGIYKYVEIRMKGDPGDRIDLFWNTAAKGGVGSAVVVESAASSDGSYHTYLLDFSAEAAWTGNLTTLRLDPTTTLSSTFEVDYIRLMAVRGPEAPVVLFSDNFDDALSTNLTDPAGRATGTLANTVKYAWATDTAAADVVVDGTLNWDSDNTKNSFNEQTANGTQSLRFGTTANTGHFNWYPYVGGKVWDVEYDTLTANSHPLNFGLSDTAQNGVFSSYDNANYDFGFGNLGTACRYDADNDAGTNLSSIASIFPSRATVYKIRLRFNEPLGKATMYVNETQVAETSTLDFENNARYITLGEPTNYAGYIDNLKVSLIPAALPAPFDVVLPQELIQNGNQFQVSGAVAGPTANQYNIAGTFGDFSAFWGSSAVVTGWSPYYADPAGLITHIGTPGQDDTGPVLDGTYYLDTLVDLNNDWIILNSSNNYRNGLKRENILNGVTVKAGATYQLKIDVSQNATTDQSLASFTAALTKGAGSTNPATAVTGSLISIAGDSVPTLKETFYQTTTISGADLLAAQTNGPVNVIFEHTNTKAIANYPASPNPLDLSQVSQLRIASLSLSPAVIPANDLNKDGVFDADDVTLANLYLAGDGGDPAEDRQADLVGQGMTSVQALAYLNLTAFDTDANGTFNAADVAALQALLANTTPDETVVINSAALVGGQFVLQISDLTVGREYRLMRGTDLIHFDDEVDSVTAASASDTLTDPSPPAGKAFYRVAN